MPYALRSALRALAHRQGLAFTVIATLTIGIGANSAIFSAVDAVLLKPLPFPAADRLVAVYESNLAQRQSTMLVAPIRLEEWNRMNRTFDGLAASFFENTTDTSGPLPERVEAMRTSPRFFSVLGVDAAIGRTFTPEEDRFGGPMVVVLSDAFWDRRFNRDRGAIGRALQLGGVTRTIVGVMPPLFRYPTATTEIWIPTQAPQRLLEAREARFYRAIGRTKPGVTPEQAQTDLSAAQAQLAMQFPRTDAGWSATVVPLKEERVAGVRRSLWLLLGAVALVLVTACWNVACLMIADAACREHEIAVRLALGATRVAVVRQLLLEGLVLSVAGATCGILLARWSIDLLKSIAEDLPRIHEVRVDPMLVVFTFAVGAATTLVFALAPAVQAARTEISTRLTHGGRAQAGGRRWLQRVLVAAQVSLAIVLLAGAGLLLRSFSRLQQVSPGFDADHVLTFRMSAQWSERTDAVANRQVRTLDRLEAVPGVLAAAFGALLPAGVDFPAGEFRVVGRDPGEHLYAHGRSVSANYFQTLRIPMLQGATCRDDSAKPFQKVVVTRTWADRFFPGDNPIGHFIEPISVAGLRQEIVGIAGDVRENGVMKDPPALMYTCGLQPYWPDPIFLVRTDPTRDVTVAAIRDALREIEPNRAMYAVRPLRDTLSRSMSQQRINAVLLTLFAITGVFLAALGLYGVTSQFVSARRREIGVRMALGARTSHILSAVAGQAAGMTLTGIGVGLAGALLLARFMDALVFGISTHDLWTFAAAPLVLGLVAALATTLPVRRATAVDPMTALRED